MSEKKLEPEVGGPGGPGSAPRGSIGGVGGTGGTGGTGGRGEQGAKGVQGEPGTPFDIGVARKALRFLVGATIFLFLSLFVVAAVGIVSNQHRISENGQRITDNKRIAARQTVDRQRNDYNLCVAVNESRDVLGDIIRGVLKATGGRGPGDASRREALVRLRLIHCPPQGPIPVH